MDGREKYDIYREMSDAIPFLERQIRDSLEANDYTVYTVFLAVAVEEERLYFCDIEYGGSPEKYKRLYQRMTREQLEKYFLLNKEVKSEIEGVDWDEEDNVDEV